MESTSKSNSLDAGNNSPETEMQDLEFGTDDHSLQEASLNSDTDSYIDGDKGFTLCVASDSDSLDTDNSPEIQPIEFVSSQMEISMISNTDFHIDSSPNAESDVEPISDVCELKHNSQESHVSHHSIR